MKGNYLSYTEVSAMKLALINYVIILLQAKYFKWIIYFLRRGFQIIIL